MTRDEVAAHVGEWYGNYLGEVSRAATDDAGNLKPAIDAALRAMGCEAAAIADAQPTDVEGFQAQAEYHALRLIVADLGTNMAISTGGDSFHLEQIRKHAMEDLERARERVLELFGTTGGSGGIVSLDLNFLTPDPCEAVG